VNDTADICDEVGDGFFSCNRPFTGMSDSVVTIVTRGTPGNNFGLKYIKFLDGREYTFYDIDTSVTVGGLDDKFELPTEPECPKPVCRSFVDVVFVLDASSSVQPNSWISQIEFLEMAVSKFALGPYDANVGIIEFAAPERTCCRRENMSECEKMPRGKEHGSWQERQQKKDRDACIQCINNRNSNPDHYCGDNYIGSWQDYTCTDSTLNIPTEHGRYMKDCAFDQRCLPEFDSTAKIYLPLGPDNVVTTKDDVYNTITGLADNRMTGHTCQRYGLKMAYEMLFVNNPRCPPGKNRTQCPTPIVIAITDGWDLCRVSTKEWADNLRAAGAQLLEVGVGLNSEYDKQYLMDISTSITGSVGYFDVKDYEAVKGILDNLMAPACSMGQLNGTTPCGVCKGYCVCGDCVCPTCETENIPHCKEYVCKDNLRYQGCKEKDVTCSGDDHGDPDCFIEYCDAEDGKCKVENVSCVPAVEAKLGRKMKQCESTSCSGGCTDAPVVRSDAWCRENMDEEPCKVWICDPGNETTGETGCRQVDKECNVVFDGCQGSICDPFLNQCVGDNCVPDLGECYNYVNFVPVHKCNITPCMVMSCDDTPGIPDKDRCSYVPFECPAKNNTCTKWICVTDAQGNNHCIEVEDTDAVAECTSKNKKDGCRTWRCDRNADEGRGACVGRVKTPEVDPCEDYSCGDDDLWVATPVCKDTKACKLAICDDTDGSCYEIDNNCHGKVKLPNKCFEPACREPDGCYKKQYRDAYFDVCGNCISAHETDEEESFSSETMMECTVTSEEELETEGLAAAAIALIVLGAIIIGAAIAISSVVGTKALIDRARNASDQAVVSNPLFEDSQTEMSNPAFIGDSV